MEIKLKLVSGKEIVVSNPIETIEEWLKKNLDKDDRKVDWIKLGNQYVNVNNIESIMEIRTYQ